MHILRQLPFLTVPSTVTAAGENIVIRPFQIVVWVSLSDKSTPGPETSLFPAVLDTGHNHNFSIREEYLRDWAGLDPDNMEQQGAAMVNRQEVPIFAGNLWLHRNRPGSTELPPNPVPFPVPQGIAVYPRRMPGSPRLPLLGLRGLVQNNLRLLIDGARCVVSLRSHR